MTKKTFVVTHPKLYLKVDGKLALIAKGTEVKMDAKSASSLVKQGKILEKGSGKKVTIDDVDENENIDDKDKTETE